MSQDLSNDIAGARSQRLSKDPRYLAALAEAEAFAAEDEAAVVQAPAAAPAPAAPAGEMKDPDLTEKEGAGFWKEAGRAIVGGPVDAIREAADLMDEGAAALQDLFYKARFDTKEEAAAAKLANPVEPVFGPVARAITPDVAKSESMVGGASRSILQFVTPFLGAMKALKGVGGATKIATAGRAMTAGAAVDFAAFDPHEKRMSNLIMDLSENDPVVGKSLFEYLSAKDGDTAIEGRFKNALEGAGLGLAVEGVFAGVRGVRAHFKAKQGDALSAIKTASGRGFDDAATAAPANTGGTLKLEVNGTAADEAVPSKAPRTPNEADVLDLGEEVARRKELGQPTLEDITKPRKPATEPQRVDSPDDMAGTRAPRTPDPEASAVTRMDTVVADLEARGADGARRAWIDPEDMSIIFTKERPVGAIDLDTKVKAAMEAAPGTRTAEDLIAIRAYRQAQEAAFPGIVKADLIGGSGREMDAALRAEALNASRPRASGGGKAAIDDTTRAEIREEGKRAAGAETRAANKSAMNERALRETAEDEVARVLANAAEIGKVAAKSQYGGKLILSQGGFVSPTLLMHLATPAVGAVVGGFSVGSANASPGAAVAGGFSMAGAAAGALAAVGVRTGKKIWSLGDITQEFPSRLTSINEKKLPVTFSKIADEIQPGMVMADIGGGRFDNAVAFAKSKGATLHVIDPFNRSMDHNQQGIAAVAGGKADIVTVNNVLNVIKEPENRLAVIEQAFDAVKPGGQAKILIYEGDKTALGRVTKKEAGAAESWQNNLGTKEYVKEVEEVFGAGNVTVKNGLIVATKPASVDGAGVAVESLIKEAKSMGIPTRYTKTGVGKMIGGDLYVHRSAEDVLPADKLAKAREALPEDFDYAVVKYNAKDDSFSFIKSPDWDKVDEPISGDAFKVNADGTLKLTKQKADPQIYHHKWNFVRDDYEGFNVAESVSRSIEWNKLDGVDKSRIGTKSFWESTVASKLQRGAANPALMANAASAGAGAVAGLAMSDDDDSWAERLSNAGMGAMAGLGVKVAAKKGASTVSDMMAGKSAAQAAKEADLESLARRVTEGIAPRSEKGVQVPKKSPTFTTAKVDGMVTALRTGDYDSIGKMLDEPDFNLANLDTEEEVDAVINAFSAAFTKETKVATRGVQSLVMTEELAKDLGASPKSLLELYRGTDNMAAKVVAHRSLLAGSSTKVTAMARHVMANPHDMDLMLALRKQVAVHAAIQARMKGVQTEVARALSSFRIKATAVDLLADERAALIDAMGGAAANVEFAKKLAMLSDPRAVNAASRKSALARTPDALFEAWVNGILSGPATHAVNVLGNTTVLGMGIVEKGLGAVIGKLRSGSDAIGSREVMTTVKGMVEGFKDAMHINMAGTGHLADAARRFAVGDLAGAERIVMESADLGSAYKALVSGQAQTDSQVYSALELLANKPSSISSAAFNLQDGSFIGGAVDYLGAVVRTPGRMLAAGDEMFKAINYRGELRAQAYRKAQDEGLEGAEFAVRVADLLDEPLPEMSKEALEAARKMTFTNPLGESGQALQRFIHTTPGVRYIAPFVRTPANILNFTFDRTPGLNMLAKRNRDDFAAGGRKRDMMLARTAMGGALYMLGWDLHQRGLITGGGDKQKGAERLAGQQQYSLKVGDQYIAFNRLDPIGIVLGLAADMHDLSGNMEEMEMQELAGAAMLAIQRNLISKSYLQGIMSLMMAVGNPDMYGEKFVQNFAGSMVPAIVNAARKNDDPVIREVWTMVDAIKNRIPGYSTEIPPHLNLLGEEVVYGKGLGVGIASPIMVKDENPSPLAQEVARLNLDLKHPPRTLSGGDGAPGIDLTPQQYYALMKLAGARFKQIGEQFVKSAAYGAIPESDDPTARDYTNAKQFVIRRMWQTSMQEARTRLIADDKDLMRKFQRTRDNGRRVLQGLPVLPVNEN